MRAIQRLVALLFMWTYERGKECPASNPMFGPGGVTVRREECLMGPRVLRWRATRSVVAALALIGLLVLPQTVALAKPAVAHNHAKVVQAVSAPADAGTAHSMRLSDLPQI